MNLTIKMAVDWIHGDTNRVMFDSQELTDADDPVIGEVEAHLREAHVAAMKAIEAIAKVKAAKRHGVGGADFPP